MDNTPEAIEVWAANLQRRFGGRPIAVCLEQSRGPLVYTLTKYPHLSFLRMGRHPDGATPISVDKPTYQDEFALVGKMSCPHLFGEEHVDVGFEDQ